MMASRGLAPFLRGALCVGLAVALHGLLLLVPWGGGSSKGGGTLRGVRVRIFAAGSAPARPVAAVPERQHAGAAPQPRLEPSAAAGPPGSAGAGMPQGSPAAEVEGERQAGAPGPPPPEEPAGEYGRFLARLRSSEMQGWAREASREARKAWRGSGSGAGERSGGWAGQGTGGGTMRETGRGGGTAYLDPRVRMVVTSYPPTGIEVRHTVVAYPDVRIRKERYTSGWWNVYFQIWTDERGKIRKITKLRPETDGPLERIFVDQVRREIDRWEFDPVAAEIIVDVRFYVE